MSIVIQAFRFASEPFFFSKAKDKDSKQTYALVMKYFVIFGLFLFLSISLNLDWLQYIVGENYRSGIKVVPILLFAYLCLGIVYNLSIWYKLSGQTKYGAVIAISGAVVTLTINILFVPQYSYMACAWATLAAYATMMILSYIFGRLYFPIKYNLRAITIYSMIALLIFIVSYTFQTLQSVGLKLFLNNFLIVIFVLVVYKLEIQNLKKIKE
jgi:O-antigen/teichoic acid export membrane protein